MPWPLRPADEPRRLLVPRAGEDGLGVLEPLDLRVPLLLARVEGLRHLHGVVEG